MKRLRYLFRRPRIELGYIDEQAHRTTPIRNAQFVSFFAETDCMPRRHVDHHDVKLRRQKWLKISVLVVVTAMTTWFVIESAHALSTF